MAVTLKMFKYFISISPQIIRKPLIFSGEMKMIYFFAFIGMLCVIWYHLYNFKNVKNTYGGVLLLGKSQALKLQAVTKSNSPSWVFFTFFKLYKWYQIMQCIAFLDSFQRRMKRFLSQFLFLSNWDWRCMG